MQPNPDIEENVHDCLANVLDFDEKRWCFQFEDVSATAGEDNFSKPPAAHASHKRILVSLWANLAEGRNVRKEVVKHLRRMAKFLESTATEIAAEPDPFEYRR
jgi:hypothetical protein